MIYLVNLNFQTPRYSAGLWFGDSWFFTNVAFASCHLEVFRTKYAGKP